MGHALRQASRDPKAGQRAFRVRQTWLWEGDEVSTQVRMRSCVWAMAWVQRSQGLGGDVGAAKEPDGVGWAERVLFQSLGVYSEGTEEA